MPRGAPVGCVGPRMAEGAYSPGGDRVSQSRVLPARYVRYRRGDTVIAKPLETAEGAGGEQVDESATIGQQQLRRSDFS